MPAPDPPNVTPAGGGPSGCRRAMVSRQRCTSQATASKAARAVGAVGSLGVDLDHLDPVAHRTEPDPGDVRRYRILRAGSDRLATTMLGLHGSSGTEGGTGAEACPCG